MHRVPRSPTPLALFALFTFGCQSPPPHRDGPRALTLEQVHAHLAVDRRAQALNAGETEVGRFRTYVTQKIEGVAAPIAEMKARCSEKVFDAGTVKLYGLEAPYTVKIAALTAETVADTSIEQVTDEADSTYTGEFVVLEHEGFLFSLFPDGAAVLERDDGGATAAVKVLRQVSAVLTAAPWTQRDDTGREWTGVRFNATAQVPAAMTELIRDTLEQAWLEDPCQ